MSRLTKQDLIAKVAEYDVIPTKKLATELVEDLIELITSTVEAGGEVSIPGFGKFEKYEKTKDGKATGKFTPKFRAFTAFKDRVAA